MMKIILDPAPLRSAIAAADKAKQDILDFEQTILTWKQQHADFIATSDPRNPDHLRDAAHSAERVTIAENYIQRYRRALAPAMNAFADAVRDFDRKFLAAAFAEQDALLDEIESLLRPYCRTEEALTQRPGFQLLDVDLVPFAEKGVGAVMFNAARSLAGQCNVFSLIPTSPATLTSFDALPENLRWQDLPDIAELTAEQNARELRSGSNVLGREARVVAGALGGSSLGPRQPGEAIQMDPSLVKSALSAQANFERLVRARAEALLARYDAWQAAGGRFVPKEFAKLPPRTLTAQTIGEAVATQA